MIIISRGDHTNFLTLKTILGNSKRSIHVVIAVSLSVAIIYSSFVIADGFVERVESMSDGYSISDILFVVENDATSISEAKISTQSVKNFFGETKISKIILCKVTTSGKQLELWGVDFDNFTDVRQPSIVGKNPQSKYEILVGENLATKHGITVGNIIETQTKTERMNLFVTGIVRSGGQYDNGLIINLETAQELRPELNEDVSLIEIKTSKANDILKSQDLSKFGLKIVQSLAMQDYIMGLALEIRRDLYLISGIITFLALISVSHTMYKILSDSMSEIMILRSMGLTKRETIQVILTNSLILSLTGAIIGLIIGNLLSNTASIFSFLVIKTVFLQTKFNLTIYLYCISISIILGIGGGITSIILKNPMSETYGTVKSI